MKKQPNFFSKMGNLTFYNPRSDDLLKNDSASFEKSSKFFRNTTKKASLDPTHSELPTLSSKAYQFSNTRTPTLPEELVRDMSAIDPENFVSSTSLPEDIGTIVQRAHNDTIKIADTSQISKASVKSPGKVITHSFMHKEHIKNSHEKPLKEYMLKKEDHLEQIYRSAHEFNSIKSSKDPHLDEIVKRKLLEDKSLNISSHLQGARGDVSHILNHKSSRSLLHHSKNIPEIKEHHRVQFARLLEELGSEAKNVPETSLNLEKNQSSVFMNSVASPNSPFSSHKLVENNLRESKFFSSPNSARRRNVLNTTLQKESRTFLSPILRKGSDEERSTQERSPSEILQSPDFVLTLASRFDPGEGNALHTLKKELPNVFSSVPSNRQEVAVLGRWLLSSLKRLHDDKTVPDRERFYRADEIYSLCFNELIRQVSIDCTERGELMMMVWKAYLSLSEDIIEDIKEKEEQAEERFQGESQKIHAMYDDILKAKESVIEELQQRIDNDTSQRLTLQQDMRFIELKGIAKAEEVVKLKEYISKLKRHYQQLQQEQRDLQYKYQKLKKNFDLVDDDPLDEQLLIAQQANQKNKKLDESDLNLSSSSDGENAQRPAVFFGRAQEKATIYEDKSIICDIQNECQEIEIQTDLVLMNEKYDQILETQEILDNIILEEEAKLKLMQAAEMMENLATNREDLENHEEVNLEDENEAQEPETEQDEMQAETGLEQGVEQEKVEEQNPGEMTAIPVQEEVINKEEGQQYPEEEEKQLEEEKVGGQEISPEMSESAEEEDHNQVEREDSQENADIEDIDQDFEIDGEAGSAPISHRSSMKNNQRNMNSEDHVVSEPKSNDQTNQLEPKVQIQILGTEGHSESNAKDSHMPNLLKENTEKNNHGLKVTDPAKAGTTARKSSRQPAQKSKEKETKPVDTPKSKTPKETAIPKKPEKIVEKKDEPPKKVVEVPKPKPAKEVPKKPEKVVVEKKEEEKPKIIVKDKPAKEQTKNLTLPIKDAQKSLSRTENLQKPEDTSKLKSSMRSNPVSRTEASPKSIAQHSPKASVSIVEPTKEDSVEHIQGEVESSTTKEEEAKHEPVEPESILEKDEIPADVGIPQDEHVELEVEQPNDENDEQEQLIHQGEDEIADNEAISSLNKTLPGSETISPPTGSKQELEENEEDKAVEGSYEMDPNLNLNDVSIVNKVETNLNLQSQQYIEDLRYEIKEEENSGQSSLPVVKESQNDLRESQVKGSSSSRDQVVEGPVNETPQNKDRKRVIKKSMTTRRANNDATEDIVDVSAAKKGRSRTGIVANDKDVNAITNMVQKAQREVTVQNNEDKKRIDKFAEKQEQRIIQLMNMYKIEKKKQDEINQANKELEKQVSQDQNVIKNLQNYVEELKKRLDTTEQSKDKLNSVLKEMEDKVRNATMATTVVAETRPKLYSSNSLDISKASIRRFDRTEKTWKKKIGEENSSFDAEPNQVQTGQYKLPAMVLATKQARKHFIQEKKSNVGLATIAKVQSKPSKTKDIVPLKSVLKQITSFYIEKMQMSKDNPLIKGQDMGTFIYKQFLNTYGFQQFALKKFTKFIISVKKHSALSRVNKFARMLGLLEANLNYNADETKQYLVALEFLLTNTTVGVHYPNPDFEKKHFAPFNRALEYLRVYSERKMKVEEVQELRRELEKFKMSDPTGRNAPGLIDIDEYLERIVAKYKALINREKESLKSVFAAGDLNNSNHISYLEFVILCRNIEAERYDERRVEDVYTNNCDVVINDEIVLSFDKFAAICFEMNIFSEQRQATYLGVSHEDDIERRYRELQDRWKEEKANLSEAIKNQSSAPSEVSKEWQDSLAWIDGHITGGKNTDLKAVLLKHRVLWGDIMNGLNRG